MEMRMGMETGIEAQMETKSFDMFRAFLHLFVKGVLINFGTFFDDFWKDFGSFWAPWGTWAPPGVQEGLGGSLGIVF